MQIRPTGPAPAERILRRSYFLSPTGCFVWAGGADSKGYGMIALGGAKYTHRIVFEFYNRKLTKGEVVRHKCDRPRCCNPEHLLAGSKGDNVRDAFERGQLKRKVSVEQVKMLREGSLTIRELQDVTGATFKHLYNIKLGHKR